jgi:hypothetical protein
MSTIGDNAISTKSTIIIIVVGDLGDLVAKKKNGFVYYYYEYSLHKDDVFFLNFLKYIWDFEL